MATPSNNTLSVTFDINRSAVGFGTHERRVPITLENLDQLVIVEQKLTAGATGSVVAFGPLTSADAVLVFTPRPVSLHINGADAPEVQVGSIAVLMDTSVTSLTIDNNAVGATDIKVEIWLVSKTS